MEDKNKLVRLLKVKVQVTVNSPLTITTEEVMMQENKGSYSRTVKGKTKVIGKQRLEKNLSVMDDTKSSPIVQYVAFCLPERLEAVQAHALEHMKALIELRFERAEQLMYNFKTPVS